MVEVVFTRRPKFCSVSLGAIVIPRGNKKSRLFKVWGGKQSILGDVQMAAEQLSVSRTLNGQELVSKRAKTIEMTE